MFFITDGNGTNLWPVEFPRNMALMVYPLVHDSMTVGTTSQ